MNYRYREHDVTHALTTYALLRYFYAASVTDDTLIANALVLAACTFPITNRSEDLFAKETVLLRTEGSVVDRLGLGNLTVRTIENVIRRGNADSYLLITALRDVMELHFDSDINFRFSGTRASSVIDVTRV